jgi:hypothetical protein
MRSIAFLPFCFLCLFLSIASGQWSSDRAYPLGLIAW